MRRSGGGEGGRRRGSGPTHAARRARALPSGAGPPARGAGPHRATPFPNVMQERHRQGRGPFGAGPAALGGIPAQARNSSQRARAHGGGREGERESAVAMDAGSRASLIFCALLGPVSAQTVSEILCFGCMGKCALHGNCQKFMPRLCIGPTGSGRYAASRSRASAAAAVHPPPALEHGCARRPGYAAHGGGPSRIRPGSGALHSARPAARPSTPPCRAPFEVARTAGSQKAPIPMIRSPPLRLD